MNTLKTLVTAGMVAGGMLFPLMRLPGVQLFECVQHPHYPGAPAAAGPLEREPGAR